MVVAQPGLDGTGLTRVATVTQACIEAGSPPVTRPAAVPDGHPSTARCVVFLSRRYADLDTAAPLLVELSARGYRVLILGNHHLYDVRDHHLTPFLVRRMGMQVEQLAARAAAEAGQGGAGAAVARPSDEALVRAAGAVLADTRPLAILMDEVLVTAANPKAGFASRFVDRFGGDGVAVIAIPGGEWITLNQNLRTSNQPPLRRLRAYLSELRTRWRTPPNRFPPDDILVSSTLWVRRLTRLGVDGRRITVAGSLRYDPAWSDRLRREVLRPPFLGDASLPDGDARLRVAVLLTGASYAVSPDRVRETVEAFARLDGVQVAVKPHPVMRSAESVRQQTGDADCAVLGDVPSSLIIDWADLIVHCGTSLAIEGFSLGKRVMELTYAHGNATLMKKLGAGLLPRSPADAAGMVAAMARGRDPGDGDQGVAALVRTIIFGGSDPFPVAARQADLVEARLAGQQVNRDARGANT